MENISAFPLLSLGADIIDDFKKYKKTIIDYTKNNKPTDNEDSSKLKHYHGEDLSVLNDISFRDLKDILLEKSTYYYKDVMGYKEDLYISDSWINVCEKGGYQSDHYHANCVVSGTLFVNLGKDFSPLVFKNPRTTNYPLCSHIRSQSDKETLYNLDYMSVKNFEEGHILLWPSYIVHGYKDNKFDQRTSLSFNLNIKSSGYLYHYGVNR